MQKVLFFNEQATREYFSFFTFRSNYFMATIRFFATSFIIAFTVIQATAQKEANVWITGDNYGFDFNYGRFRVFDRNPLSRNGATTASICDKETGELLFYSDGNTVYDKNFNIMPNGKGIISGSLFGQQDALIMPAPGQTNKYYLFTVSSVEGARENGLYYTLIDLSLNGGRGDVVTETKNTLIFADASEAITGTIHDNGKDFWLATHERGSDRFVIFPVTDRGVEDPAFYSFGPIYTSFPGGGSDGSIQISPDRTLLTFNMNQDDTVSPVELYDFDAGTGAISNRRELGEYSQVSTLIFSPDNSKLYMGSYNWESWPPLYGYLFQYDLTAGSIDTIINSRDSIRWQPRPTTFPIEVPVPSYNLQIGPDGRLYNGYITTTINENLNAEQRLLFLINEPNAILKYSYPSYIFIDYFKTNHWDDNEQSFPNFMQYYFNGLEPDDPIIMPKDCKDINFVIYPNPTDDDISIMSNKMDNCLYPVKIIVYNAQGKKLQAYDLPVGPLPVIDLVNYGAGIYLVKLQSFNQTIVKKIIKL
ncbi:MAG: T9SS type A sorting domain-containing protein [Cyclobacteriaceae bacterium]